MAWCGLLCIEWAYGNSLRTALMNLLWKIVGLCLCLSSPFRSSLQTFCYIVLDLLWLVFLATPQPVHLGIQTVHPGPPYREVVQCLTHGNKSERTVQKKQSEWCRWILAKLYRFGFGLPNWYRIFGVYFGAFLAWRYLVWPMVALLQPCSWALQLSCFALCGELAAGISRRSLKTTKTFTTIAKCRMVQRRRVKMARRCHISIAPSLNRMLQSVFAKELSLRILFGNNCMFVSRCFVPDMPQTEE